ncbi:MAG TPA: sigma-70 family RNA polymerase sigma factor [Acidimicrobiales bacterium]|nr:sigma-70 family RNA polymerase sigma factor [Acidimicrobiales bacterium]
MDHRSRPRAPGQRLRGLRHRLVARLVGTLAPIDEGRGDRELAEAAQAGDRGALDTLLRRHLDRLHGLCRRLLGSDADADDATQEALVAIARGLGAGRFDGRSSFGTWAYRVTTNACLDELRRRGRRPGATSDEDLERALSATTLPAGCDGPGGGPDAVAGRLDVEAALRRLPLDFRAPVVLRDLCGLDYAEIADVLAIPPGTVRSRIARGRAALVPLLGNPAPPADRPTPRP